MVTALRIHSVPISTLAAFMEACAAHPTDSAAELAEYAGFSLTTAKRAIPTLESLGVVMQNSDGTYVVLAPGVRRGMNSDSQHLVLRKALLGFRPFEAVSEGLAFGESESDAMRKAILLLGLPSQDVAKLAILLKLAEELGVVQRDDGALTLVSEFAPVDGVQGLSYSEDDLESEARARLFNAKVLGRNANNYLDAIDRGLLAEALIKHKTDPRRSIEHTGQAIEDFLRHVADDAGHGADGKKASGAGQLANVLYANAVIHNHHQKLVDAVATVRNATAHRKDKKSLTPWDLTPFGALSAHALALTAIRSIHQYTSGGVQSI
jgi:hypothetical protein